MKYSVSQFTLVAVTLACEIASASLGGLAYQDLNTNVYINK